MNKRMKEKNEEKVEHCLCHVMGDFLTLQIFHHFCLENGFHNRGMDQESQS